MEDEDHLDERIRLTRDLIVAAREMGDEEARYLVDAYYQTQENRKRTDNQVRSMGDAPGFLISWMAEKNWTLECQLKRALGEYTEAHPMGDWMRNIRGIGPVLSAGFLAHINMDHSPTVGHIWQFAGIAGHRQQEEERKAAYHVTFKKAVDPNNPPEFCLKGGYKAIPYYPDGSNAYVYQLTCGKEEAYLPDEEAEGVEDIEEVRISYRNSGQKPWEKGMKRPFNAQLKVLCWKTGQSFMKLSNRADCYYGRVYRARKEYEIARNEAGLMKETAAAQLPHFGKSTQAYAHYASGKLPPAQIDARSRRYAVKLFLSHLHGEWHERKFGRPAPLPYPIAFMEHVHFIHPSEGQTKDNGGSMK
jgi:hypothetical protein